MAVSGRVPLALLAGLAPLAFYPAGVLVLVWTAAVLLAVAADLVLAVSPRALEVRRELPGSVRLSEPGASSVTVANPTRRTARIVFRDAWPPSAGVAPGADRHAARIPPGESRRGRTELFPSRRGDLTAGAVTVRSFGPLRLAARQRSRPAPGRLRVLPEFRSRKHLPYRLARLRELDGRAAVQVRGQGTEFDSLREYQIGDDVRSIDWRATARGERVVVRTWRPERDRRVVIVLDTSRWAAGRVLDQTRLDAGIEASLLLGALAAASGDRVDVIAADRRVRARTGSTVGHAAVAEISDALAPVEASLVEADWPFIAAAVRRTVRQRALLVLITSTDPALVEEGLAGVLGALTRRHAVMVATVRDPEEAQLREAAARPSADSDAAYDAAASERRELALAAMEGSLKSLGAHVVAATPEALAPAVADGYLALKAAGQL
ncbi:MAG: DUF58 domain-containing protein [Bifidobacteriaceae bacterium]|jgi:uncharacterized protein (DUF58 family)|nr:DUF58 domain-containing protein [Bifidobacteriaceae bacterium]